MTNPIETPRPKLFRWRRLMVGAGIVGLAAVGLTAALIHESNRRDLIEFEASRHRISASELEFMVALAPGSAKGDYTLQGRVRNHSPLYRMTSASLALTMRDRLPSGSGETVGEATAYISVNVPPNQSRNVSEQIRFRDLPVPLGKLEWTYAIDTVYAK